jgi:hypothetical protein
MPYIGMMLPASSHSGGGPASSISGGIPYIAAKPPPSVGGGGLQGSGAGPASSSWGGGMPYIGWTLPIMSSSLFELLSSLMLQPVTATVAANVNAARRSSLRPAAGTARDPRSLGNADAQNGHADSLDRTWREQAGQGTRAGMAAGPFVFAAVVLRKM